MSKEKPATEAFAITPNDSTTFYATRALWVGGTGQIKVDMGGSGTAITFKGIPAGTLLPIEVTRVYATDTDASMEIVGLR